tara:strand:- start:607 stop:933 length:327 start_codon:yes stop_codon:yes gene_type:complete
MERSSARLNPTGAVYVDRALRRHQLPNRNFSCGLFRLQNVGFLSKLLIRPLHSRLFQVLLRRIGAFARRMLQLGKFGNHIDLADRITFHENIFVLISRLRRQSFHFLI